MYSFNLENIIPSGGLACLIAKATVDESNKWHRRLGHVNFKNLNNKLGEGKHLLEDYHPISFKNTNTVCWSKRESNTRASCKAKSVTPISQLFTALTYGLILDHTSIRSKNTRPYCLVYHYDLAEFKNRDIIEFCGSKRIKREYSNARTPQKNRVAEKKNRTLIEAARTMLANSFLPNTFWLKQLVLLLRKGHSWLLILDLTDSMNYQPVRSENQANKHAGLKEANYGVSLPEYFNTASFVCGNLRIVRSFKLRLVPLCCVIFDLEPLSLSFDLVFKYEILKSFSLQSLPSYDLVS
ncbi:putative ribonuclease H-like domain-containing protein [Tanacetum coccineum]